MLAELERHIETNRLLNRRAPALVGVSGGADSLCILVALQQLGFPVICAHFDHQLREDSRTDAEFVQAFAAARTIPFVLGHADVEAHRLREGGSVEEVARELRYQFLFREARSHHAQAVVTGHTADDQVETVLMHFLRGAGLSGLKGMLPSVILPTFDPDLPLVRPLLAMERDSVIRFCANNEIVFRTDSSNAELTFFRNRLRSELIPLLETYNPGFRQVLHRNALVLGMEQAALESFVDDAWSVVSLGSAAEWVQFNRDAFLTQPLGVQARLLRRAAQQLRPALRDFDYAAVMRGLDAVASGAVRRATDLVDGVKVLLEGSSIWIAADWEPLPLDAWPQIQAGPEKITVPGEMHLNDGWRLVCEWAPDTPAAPGSDTVLLDADRLEDDLLLRRRQPGDRFAPAGMNGHSVKLSDFMINEKLPKRARSDWPLLVSGDEIVWVAGMRMSENYVPTSSTRRFLKLTLTRR